MRHLMKRRRTLLVVLCMVLTLAFSAIAFAGIATTSPLGFKPFAGLGSCPLGAVSQVFTR
ncbi:hypothetical protein ACFLSZ_00635 [Candidatus Bipolaricaulota bacterium]